MKLTIRPSLLSSLSLISASLLVGVGSARAQECTADADCDENFECVHYDEPEIVTPSSTPMTGSVGGDATPADNIAPPATNCDGDGCDDTGVNEGAQASGGGSSGGAAMTTEGEPPADEDRVAVRPEADGGAPLMATEESSMGSCQPTILTCGESADCPDPAVCEDGECVFMIEECEADDECGADFVCTVFSRTGSISSSAGTSSPPSNGTGTGTTTASSGSPVMMPDGAMADTDVAGTSGGTTPSSGSGSSTSAGGSEADPTMDDKPLPPTSTSNGDSEDDPDGASAPAPGAGGAASTPEEQTMVTVTDNSACFPALVECDSDADCSGDWTCEDMSERAPLGWGDVEKACLPPAITAALAGHVRTGGDTVVSQNPSALGGEGSSAPGEVPRGPTDADGNPIGSEMGVGMGNTNEVESPVELGTQGGTEGSMGCSTGPRTPRGSLTWLAALGALVFASRRRKG